MFSQVTVKLDPPKGAPSACLMWSITLVPSPTARPISRRGLFSTVSLRRPVPALYICDGSDVNRFLWGRTDPDFYVLSLFSRAEPGSL